MLCRSPFRLGCDGNSPGSRGLLFSRRVSPVERMYAAFPAFIYFNASLGAAMLEPLLIAQDNLTDLNYAAQDLGELMQCHRHVRRASHASRFAIPHRVGRTWRTSARRGTYVLECVT